MNILITGSNGFAGKNLVESLKSIRDGKDRRAEYQGLLPIQIFECNKGTSPTELARYCAKADFVFNFAGENRPPDPKMFLEGNCGFLAHLLDLLEKAQNDCPVMLASSVQASLSGRYEGSEYGKSKREAERRLFDYSKKHDAPVYIFRFPNLYGKWCRPNYNSAVATFCDAIANNKPYSVNDPSVVLELLYIDDLVETMLQCLLGRVARCNYEGNEVLPDESGLYCYVPRTDKISLGEIVQLLEEFKMNRSNLMLPWAGEGTFASKLFSMFESYYDPANLAYPLVSHSDERGAFSEFLRTEGCGQISINYSKPGVTKGNHWHNSKWEKFLVVSGEALIRQRKIGKDSDGFSYPVQEYYVRGDRPEVVEMIPGYTHSITNLSQEDDLVTVMWANELFDPDCPDTYYEEV